jgi:hypothetical protein
MPSQELKLGNQARIPFYVELLANEYSLMCVLFATDTRHEGHQVLYVNSRSWPRLLGGVLRLAGIGAADSRGTQITMEAPRKQKK